MIISIILIFQSGLRNVAVGSDTFAYSRSFEWVKQMDWGSVFKTVSDYYLNGIGKDPGYIVLQKVVQYVVGDYQIFLFLIALLFFTALGKFIYKNTSRIWEAVFAFTLYSALFYSFFSITGHRQTIATAAALFGFELIKKRKLLPFLVLIFLASTVHRSCLVFLPFYFLYNLKQIKIIFPLNPDGISYNYVLSCTTFMKRCKILEDIRTLKFMQGAGTYTFTCNVITGCFMAWWRMKYVLYENENARPFFNAFILAIFFTPLTWVNPNAMRVVQYFSIFLIVLISHCIGELLNTRI